MKNDTKRLTVMSFLIAVAMILSYVESRIPVFVAVPGVKMGLTNIASVFALYTLGAPYAVCVSVVRVFLSSLLFGNFVSMLYSLGGAALALLSMVILKRFNVFSAVGVSVVGAVMHNVGQIIVACIVMENAAISLYIVPLAISGVLSGIAVGFASGLLVEKLKGRLKINTHK